MEGPAYPYYFPCISSIFACFILSVVYVSSLYVWNSPHSRDHPSTIKKRFMSVFVMMFVSPLFLYVFSGCDMFYKVSRCKARLALVWNAFYITYMPSYEYRFYPRVLVWFVQNVMYMFFYLCTLQICKIICLVNLNFLYYNILLFHWTFLSLVIHFHCWSLAISINNLRFVHKSV